MQGAAGEPEDLADFGERDVVDLGAVAQQLAGGFGGECGLHGGQSSMLV